MSFKKRTLLKSIRFKFSVFLCIFGFAAIAAIYGIMLEVIMRMEEDSIADRLVADINYLEDLIGDGDWNVRDGAIYLGDTLIGDGTEERANFKPFLDHERKTGTFSYVFIKTSDKGLGYVEDTPTQKGYYQGNFQRVAGSTKDPNGESIVGTYIAKPVADALNAHGTYKGEANVAGGMIYCQYDVLKDSDGQVVGAIVVGRNISELQKQVNEVLGSLSLSVILSLIIFGGMLFLFANRWISAIQTIVVHLRAIEDGSLPDKPLVFFAEDEMSTLVTGINHMVDSLREKEALRKKSEIDQLTGLANRFGLNRHFEVVFEDCYKNHKPLAVGIMDVDFFKPFNDNYGHQAGDECIVMLADILKEIEAEYGVFCARFGGDEFITISSGRNLREIESIAQKIKEKVLERRVPHGHSRVSDIVTISQGYCYGVPTQHKKLNDYVYLADGAMYEVKEDTKNGFKIVEMTSAFRPTLSGTCKCRF